MCASTRTVVTPTEEASPPPQDHSSGSMRFDLCASERSPVSDPIEKLSPTPIAPIKAGTSRVYILPQSFLHSGPLSMVRTLVNLLSLWTAFLFTFRMGWPWCNSPSVLVKKICFLATKFPTLVSEFPPRSRRVSSLPHQYHIRLEVE